MKFTYFYIFLVIYLTLTLSIKVKREKTDRLMKKQVGQGNWGICGFVAVVNSLHNSGTVERFGKHLSLSQIEMGLGNEIKAYLLDRVAKNSPILQQILDFTKSFGAQYDYKTIANVIKEIETRVKTAAEQGGSAIHMQSFGLAMTANSLKDYIDYVGKKSEDVQFTSDAVSHKNLKQFKNCAIGLANGSPTQLEKGLKHWVFVGNDSKLYNWGRADLLNDTDKPAPGISSYRIAYVIRIK